MKYRQLFDDHSYSGWYREGIHDEYEGLMLLLSSEEKQDPIFRLLFSYIFFCMDQDDAEKGELSSFIDEIIMKKLAQTVKVADCA